MDHVSLRPPRLCQKQKGYTIFAQIPILYKGTTENDLVSTSNETHYSTYSHLELAYNEPVEHLNT